MEYQTREPRAQKGYLLLEDGSRFSGLLVGAEINGGLDKAPCAELCFTTAMSGYQEALSDPSYAGEILVFSFPHIGIAGCNGRDQQRKVSAMQAAVTGAKLGAASNFRAEQDLDSYLIDMNLPLLSAVDTRQLILLLRSKGALRGVILPSETFDELGERAVMAHLQSSPGLKGQELGSEARQLPFCRDYFNGTGQAPKVALLDYGVKEAIVQLLIEAGLELMPIQPGQEQLALTEAAGLFVSNGPGDPSVTAGQEKALISSFIDSGKPTFGICLGHQLLASCLGLTTEKMPNGHHGVNHPVYNFAEQRVEITSQNHNFMVSEFASRPDLKVTHRSLFDNSIEGIEMQEKPVFAVQYHPEANPGTEDSRYLIQKFARMILEAKD